MTCSAVVKAGRYLTTEGKGVGLGFNDGNCFSEFQNNKRKRSKVNRKDKGKGTGFGSLLFKQPF
jgi:hypothetical protein